MHLLTFSSSIQYLNLCYRSLKMYQSIFRSTWMIWESYTYVILLVGVWNFIVMHMESDRECWAWKLHVSCLKVSADQAVEGENWIVLFWPLHVKCWYGDFYFYIRNLKLVQCNFVVVTWYFHTNDFTDCCTQFVSVLHSSILSNTFMYTTFSTTPSLRGSWFLTRIWI